ncbi:MULTISPECIES: AEC family transporter [unclassified Luteococcus]|uniref:AEC family transporter n=1 Tax=unclassified Luteococcus TaxID=2639923 RepID=UPI00313F10BC
MDILVKALSLVAIIAVGFWIKRLGWVRASDFELFAKIVLRITLPCALITSFNQHQIPLPLLGLAGLGLAVNLVLQVTALTMERRRGRQAQAFAVINLPSFNMGAFATPYLAGFMGPAAVVQASIFDIGNALGAAGIGYAWGTGLADESRRTTVGRFLRAMFSSVVFDVYIALLLLNLAHVRLPDAVITFTSTVGAANTFLAMLMIGVGLEVGLDGDRFRQAGRYLGVRYLVCALCAAAVWFLPVPREYRVLVAMVLFAPVASMTPGFTAQIRGDVQLSTLMNSVSILVGMVMLPVVLLVLG